MFAGLNWKLCLLYRYWCQNGMLCTFIWLWFIHWSGGRLNSSWIMLSSRCLSCSHPNLILFDPSKIYVVYPLIFHSSCTCSPFVFQCAKADYFYLFWLFWGCLLLVFFVSIKLLLFLLEKQLSIFKLDALAGWVIALYCIRLWKSCCWAEATEILV